MRLADSRILVTGGASGLGRATAAWLAERDASVAIVDLETSPGAEFAAEIGAVFAAADVTETAQVEAAVAAVSRELGGIDVCVNAAGILSAHRFLTRDGDVFPLELFDRTIQVNLIGTFDVARRCAAVMAGNEPGESGERGVIINIASTAAFDGQIGQAAYSASKGGIVSMTLPLARDLGSLGVRVMAIAPGPMQTPMLEVAPDDLKERLVAANVFPKRFGLPQELAGLVGHIIENPMLNGSVVRLDAAARMPPR